LQENPDEWGPLVEQFLAKLNLPATEIIPPAPEPDPSKLPDTMSDSVKQAFLRYVRLGPNKAFSCSPDGRAWGYTGGKATRQQAKKSALSERPTRTCKVIASEEWAPASAPNP
jgi:hypothetical protein